MMMSPVHANSNVPDPFPDPPFNSTKNALSISTVQLSRGLVDM